MQEKPDSQPESSYPLVQEVGQDMWRSRGFGAPDARPIPSPEQEGEMNREIIAVGKLLNGSGLWWQLDGGFNISLLKGKYVGVHVDVDVSLEKKDLPELEKYLLAQGYGLFKVAKNTGSKRILTRVGAVDFKSEYGYNLRIAPIDEKGVFRKDFNIRSVEVVVVSRNEQGRYKDGWTGADLPEEWLHWKSTSFHGVEIPLSHPAKFIFYKIFFQRGGFDEKDVDAYIALDVLTEKDLGVVEKLTKYALEKMDADVREEARICVERRLEKIRRKLGK